jgi:DNA-binding SARP family transcriptional activator
LRFCFGDSGDDDRFDSFVKDFDTCLNSVKIEAWYRTR